MKLVFASNNKHKIQEIKMLVEKYFSVVDTDKYFEIVGLEQIGCLEDIPETADTVEGNAIIKADYVTQNYDFSCFADDSALEVEVLNGNPGVFSARYAGEQKNDDDNIRRLLSQLEDETNRNAQFKTVIALNLNREQHIFTGIVKGKITTEKRGTNGFGYDPIFVPDGYDRTFAELNTEEKNKISHRALAFEQLSRFLTNSL